MPKQNIEWKFIFSKSKKKNFAAEHLDGKITVNLTNHHRVHAVHDLMESFDHEVFHFLIDDFAKPKKISDKKQHFIIEKLLEDWH